MKPLRSVLIANRGEIAVRVAHTLRRMGIRSVLSCHAVDANEPAARAVDELRLLTGSDPIAAYLDREQIVKLARDAGCDAIHPGYGFLAENADFADAVAAAGLRFIGPPSAAIRLMGDKVASRAFAKEHGCHMSTSVVEADNPLTFETRMRELSMPLLVKASAGGGGKGIQIVRTPDELGSAIERCRSESERFFDDGRLYAEPYIERSRHIEVQILADKHGNCIHLLDRECSVQRRFQKLVEEAPAPNLPDAARESMRREAVALARAVGYEGVGTVEFIVDPSGQFFFLEMNTRLQVEHPVTECVTGIDLVEQQVRVAAGEVLSMAQESIAADGHSIEVRICAEAPEHDFAPATGAVRLLRVHEGAGIRFDTGIATGSEVTTSFDPMLAKLISHGVDRGEAIDRLVEAARETVLLGVATNTSYLARVVDHRAFRSAELHTGFVTEHASDLAREVDDELLRRVLVAAALSHRPLVDAANAVPAMHRSMGRWRN